MDKIINVGLISNPFNWVIIVLMLVLAFLGAEVVFNQFSSQQ